MSNTIYSRKEIPNAPYYVLSNDSFMSGWGEAQGKTNTVILPCQDYEEAAFVESRAHLRSDQKRIRIVMNKPSLRSNVLYSLLTPGRASAWYGLCFVLRRANDPAEGLTFDCPDLRELDRDTHYNVNISNAYHGLHSLSAKAANLGEALSKCAEIADEAGCRHITLAAE